MTRRAKKHLVKSPSNINAPSFFIIGAMKCGTSTLYDQLRRSDEVFLPELKEPNFFSDDENFNRGLDWYLSLFDSAKSTSVVGEASTHYAKLPRHPHTLERLSAFNSEAKIIYVMRDPIERIVSHFIHEWSMNKSSQSMNQEVLSVPDYVDFSKYNMQISPYLNTFGSDNVLPVFLERIRAFPDREISRIHQFLGLNESKHQWDASLSPSNVSSKRIKRFFGYAWIIESKLGTFLRRALVPRYVRAKIKNRFTMSERPSLTPETKLKLSLLLDQDLKQLGDKLNTELTSDQFQSQVLNLDSDYRFTR